MIRIFTRNCIRGTIVITAVMLAGSALGTSVGLGPDNPTFVGGDLQTIEIFVEDVQDLLGATLVLEFDPTVVNPVGVSLGDFMSQGPCSAFFQWINSGDYTNTLELDAAMLGCSVAGSGVLFEIVFAGVGAGTSQLNFLTTELRDNLNFPIEIAAVDGAITYLPEVLAGLMFHPESVFFDEDLTTEICLKMENVSNFMGMSVEFQFDPEVIWPTSVLGGPGLADASCPYYLNWLNAGEVVNTVELDLALLGCSTDANGAMVCIVFEGVDFGESPLTWLSGTIRNNENENILINLFDGMVLYSPTVAVETVSFGSMKTMYRN